MQVSPLSLSPPPLLIILAAVADIIIFAQAGGGTWWFRRYPQHYSKMLLHVKIDKSGQPSDRHVVAVFPFSLDKK